MRYNYNQEHKWGELWSKEQIKYFLSAKHDVIHLLVLGLKQNHLIPQDHDETEKYILKAVYRYERLRYEYDNLCDALGIAQIPFLTLKGSVIRKYYPEAWMRDKTIYGYMHFR